MLLTAARITSSSYPIIRTEPKTPPFNQGFFEIAPDLLAYGQHIAGDTTVHNQITLEATDGTHTGSPTSLFFIQPGGSGPLFVAWNETVTVDGDPNTYDQVEFVRHDATASP